MILISHPLGNANVRHAVQAFADAGELSEFWTCVAWDPDGVLARRLPARVAGNLARRAFDPAVRARPHTASGWREAGRHLAARLPGALRRALTRHETGPFSVDAVFRAFDRAVARRVRRMPRGGGTISADHPAGNVHAVYAYEDGAAETFRAAAERGWRRFYDLPIGYWRAGQAIFAEEAEREPAWAPTLTGRGDSGAKHARKDAELAAADRVFVASRFTERTLREHAPAGLCPAQVHVVPYGAPTPVAEAASALGNGGGESGLRRPLRVLFAGSLGQRKGLSYLLEAMRIRCPRHVTLTLLGMKTAEGCAPLEAATRAHRWIPSLPHAGVLAEMARADVLVFPSLFEGFGLVIPEAFSRGVPVIATAHTALPDLLTAEGGEGYVVPVRSAGSRAERREGLAADRGRLRAMQRAALARAGTLRWEDYRRRLVGLAGATH